MPMTRVAMQNAVPLKKPAAGGVAVRRPPVSQNAPALLLRART